MQQYGFWSSHSDKMKVTPLKLFFIGLFIGLVSAVMRYAGASPEGQIVSLLTIVGGLVVMVSIVWIVFTKKKLD